MVREGFVPAARDATNTLAYLHDLGLGVPQDRQRALALYSTAADLGSAEAMWNIANLYGAGQLGAKDLVSACVWATRSERWARSTEMALKQAVAGATPFFRQNLSRAQYTRCIDDAMQWSPKHPPS